MPYEAEIEEFSQGALQAHQGLEEVVFLRSPNTSLLVFADGTVLPTWFPEKGDQAWQVMYQEFNTHPYFERVGQRLGGTDPMSLLAFGYHGTGSECFERFLRIAGFASPSVADVSPPLRLRKDGTRLGGQHREDTIEWEDGSQTPEPRWGTAHGPQAGGFEEEVRRELDALGIARDAELARAFAPLMSGDPALNKDPHQAAMAIARFVIANPGRPGEELAKLYSSKGSSAGQKEKATAEPGRPKKKRWRFW